MSAALLLFEHFCALLDIFASHPSFGLPTGYTLSVAPGQDIYPPGLAGHSPQTEAPDRLLRRIHFSGRKEPYAYSEPTRQPVGTGRAPDERLAVGGASHYHSRSWRPAHHPGGRQRGG